MIDIHLKLFNNQLYWIYCVVTTNQFADLTFDEFSNLYLMDPQVYIVQLYFNL